MHPLPSVAERERQSLLNTHLPDELAQHQGWQDTQPEDDVARAPSAGEDCGVAGP